MEGDDGLPDDGNGGSSSSSRLVPRTVVFNFRSLETSIIPQEGGMEGVLCVPMLQDLTSGRLMFQAGITTAEGTAWFNNVWFADPDYDVHGDAKDGNWESVSGVILRKNYEEEFKVHFHRQDGISSPIDNVTLGYHAQINTVYNEARATLVRSDKDMVPKNFEEGQETREYFPFESRPRCKFEQKKCLDRVNDEWESKNFGTCGLLVVYANCHANDNCMTWQECDTEDQFDTSHGNTWRADYKIKLYMDISEVIPADSCDDSVSSIGMSGASSIGILQNKKNDTVADWNALIDLMETRFPNYGKHWAERAVKNYRYFMDLKKKKRDWDSKVYCPSKSIDEVWKAHICFPERYQEVSASLTFEIIASFLMLFDVYELENGGSVD